MIELRATPRKSPASRARQAVWQTPTWLCYAPADMRKRHLVAAALALASCKQERAARIEPVPELALDAGAAQAVATPPPAIAPGAHIYVELAVYHSTPGAVEKAKALLASEHSVLHFEEKPSRDSLTPAVFIREPALEAYRPPDESRLKYFGHGFEPHDVRHIAASKHVTVVGVTARRGDEGTAALRAAHVLALDLARAVSGYIWDEGSREAFTPAAFEKRRLAAWSGGLPRASSQYVIHAYRERELIRLITLGMDKLGLPDLVVENAADGLSSRLANVIVLVAQTLAEGGRPARQCGSSRDTTRRAIRRTSYSSSISVRGPSGRSAKRHSSPPCSGSRTRSSGFAKGMWRSPR